MVEIGNASRETIDSQEGSSGYIVGKPKSKKLEGTVELGEELLPGIPNDITLDLIAPKLPWTTFHRLSSVSHGWEQAIQSPQVYDARVRTQSGQTLLVMNTYLAGEKGELGLYSLRDGACYHLPPLPGGTRKYVLAHQCIFLDGKLYVLGGYSSKLSAEVYMLDLLGQKQWRQCASMADPRAHFGSCAINGKIFVFGGTTWPESGATTYGATTYASEVYNPESNAWSPIAPTTCAFDLVVVNWGEELLVHYQHGFEACAEIYNPLKNQWRSADQSLTIQPKEIPLIVGGKLYTLSFTPRGIDVYYSYASSRERVHTFSIGDFGPRNSSFLMVYAALIVDDELLGVACWQSFDEPDVSKSFKTNF